MSTCLKYSPCVRPFFQGRYYRFPSFLPRVPPLVTGFSTPLVLGTAQGFTDVTTEDVTGIGFNINLGSLVTFAFHSFPLACALFTLLKKILFFLIEKHKKSPHSTCCLLFVIVGVVFVWFSPALFEPGSLRNTLWGRCARDTKKLWSN